MTTTSASLTETLPILDLDEPTVWFHSIRYNTRACRRALREQGLPERAYHPVSRLGPAAPVVRGLLGFLRRAKGARRHGAPVATGAREHEVTAPDSVNRDRGRGC